MQVIVENVTTKKGIIMNALEITFCIFAYMVFGLMANIAIIAPLIKDYNNTKTNKIPLPLTIIILIITPFIYPLIFLILLVIMYIMTLKDTII